MIDSILEHQPLWRYCNVRAGEKKPYPANWQRCPLTLDQVESTNIGMILGPLGNGVAAIDFDGTSAWQWIREQGVTEITRTPTWTSGRPDRCQMAFLVPEEVWPVLRTKKIATAAGEGFEFRWAGAQSVLPPSQHPVTGRPYEWIVSAQEPMAQIPDAVLITWLEQLNTQQPQALDPEPERTLDDITDFEIREAESVLQILKRRLPALTYDDWRTVCWGIAHHVGREAAGVLIRSYYPEQQSGEYQNLFRSWNKARSPTLGSVRYLAGITRR